jgi:hypothetical protein
VQREVAFARGVGPDPGREIERANGPGVGWQNVISFLLYYGVLGIKKVNEEAIYIYDVNYDIDMLHVRIRKWTESTVYVVNPALWPALQSKRDQPLLV